MQQISMSDPRLQYMGRIDHANPEEPLFLYAGSWVRIAFTGDEAAVVIRNHPVYHAQLLGYLLDGVEGVFRLPDGDFSAQTLTLPVPAGGGTHTLTLFKRNDGCQSYRLCGLLLADDAAVCALPPLPDFKIELFGDSVSAGCVCEAVGCVAQCDPPDDDGSADNALHAFGVTAARLLGAQLHNNAQGGLALLDGTGYFHNGELGLVSTYNKLSYFPETDTGVTDWDFSRYVPDLVIFAVGQNDHHIGTTDNNLLTGAARRRWLDTYAGLVRTLMGHYPAAEFWFTLTLLQHDSDFERLFDELVAELNDARVKRFRFTRTGAATPGHPRIPEQAEMAVELALAIGGGAACQTCAY